MLEFEWLWMFLCLPLPLLVYFFLPKAQQEQASLRVPFFHRAERALNQQSGLSRSQSLLNLCVLGLIWLMLVSAAAKPQWLGEAITLPSSGRDLLVAVDISGSMETADMVVEDQQIPRVLVVKYVVGEFLERRVNDRLGLILFGTNAYLQSPLTFDRKTVNQLLQEAQLGFAGEKTAIGDAIGLAIKRLKDRPDSQRVLILLTDGANTAGEVAPRKAADLAKQAGVKIYTIGVGADEMVVRQGLFGTFNRKVNPSADLDEATLQYIAETTGGQYFRARNPAELAGIYNVLDTLEPVEQEADTYRPTRSLYFWPLAAALITSLLLAIGKMGLSLLNLSQGKREVKEVTGQLHSHQETK
ncbi:vWA domain-containing protein [Agarilytica rhodophyticola]|uniref:vWA domain-containing protein n=1 Tax=Agarilytica rhodophyticola TaxID=1737490 RepID=UPI000B349208|nr:VWA domain-containing protein [Agarilytica rhodophyticola]